MQTLIALTIGVLVAVYLPIHLIMLMKRVRPKYIGMLVGILLFTESILIGIHENSFWHPIVMLPFSVIAYLFITFVMKKWYENNPAV